MRLLWGYWGYLGATLVNVQNAASYLIPLLGSYLGATFANQPILLKRLHVKAKTYGRKKEAFSAKTSFWK